MDKLLTLTQAAKEMKCSREWVFYLIKNERLKAENVGGIYIIRAKDLAACKVRPRAKPTSNGQSPSRTRGKKRAAKKVKAERSKR